MNVGTTNGEPVFLDRIILASMLRAGFSVVTKAGLSLDASGPTMLVIASTCWMVGGLILRASQRKKGEDNR